MIKELADILEKNQMPCPSKTWFHIDCPGCGMQRAFIELLRGNFYESITTYPALIPVMFLLVFLVLHLIFSFKYGSQVLKYSFIFTVSIIVIQYIYKIIHHTI